MPHRATLASDGDMYITYGNGCGPHGTKTEAMDKGQIWKYQISTGALTESSIEANQAGDYVAVYTNSEGCQSTKTFKVAVNSAGSSSART